MITRAVARAQKEQLLWHGTVSCGSALIFHYPGFSTSNLLSETEWGPFLGVIEIRRRMVLFFYCLNKNDVV